MWKRAATEASILIREIEDDGILKFRHDSESGRESHLRRTSRTVD